MRPWGSETHELHCFTDIDDTQKRLDGTDALVRLGVG